MTKSVICDLSNFVTNKFATSFALLTADIHLLHSPPDCNGYQLGVEEVGGKKVKEMNVQ